jgi:hypothetical protein
MSGDFHFDIKRDGKDFPAFIDGKRVERDGQGQHFVTIGGRKWVLGPDEAPLETLPDPEQFQLFPPPPRLVTFWGKLTLLLGGGIPGLMIFGMIFVCFGMIFVCLVVGSGAADTYAVWRENGTAKITTIKESNVHVNDNKVFAYSFSGQDADGNEVTGVSHAYKNQFQEGQTVPLQRAGFFGGKWRLKDAKFSAAGIDSYIVLLTLIFPIVGICLVFFGTILPGLKRAPLIKYGELALASFLRQESTSTSINEKPVQKLVFQFETPDGEQHEAILKTLEPDKFLSDNRRKIVFYSPDNPKKNMVWDSVASMMKFDEFQQRFTGFTINTLIFPVFFAVFCFEVVWFFNNVMTGKMFF